ncbi:MAG: amino acid ABC transporter substrate-binding protein [Deltaproteobacteria bacterium]|nr:amino acid ABC transporter substrate-binding protein [Deltaproteobacteria bacterium]
MRFSKLNFFISFLFLFAVSFQTNLSQGKELKFALNHWPPNKIQNPIGGIDVYILKNIANRLNLKIRFIECPWKRCLTEVKFGRIDIASSLLKTPDREKYIAYTDPPYRTKSPKVFYLQKGKGHLIKKYEDLYKLEIGVMKGSKYFSPFDDDSKINKYEVIHENQLIKMLSRNRLDAFLITEIVGDYLIIKEGYKGQFEKAPFRDDSEVRVYFGISKKSPFANEISRFNKVIKEMVTSGEINKVIKRFYEDL